ncbi:hypothetical protein JX266_014282 [Neoarthrinium moseri]|nr:hypothetical protein JX266_014282 [Neoarthrinium moseri]
MLQQINDDSDPMPLTEQPEAEQHFSDCCRLIIRSLDRIEAQANKVACPSHDIFDAGSAIQEIKDWILSDSRQDPKRGRFPLEAREHRQTIAIDDDDDKEISMYHPEPIVKGGVVQKEAQQCAPIVSEAKSHVGRDYDVGVQHFSGNVEEATAQRLDCGVHSPPSRNPPTYGDSSGRTTLHRGDSDDDLPTDPGNLLQTACQPITGSEPTSYGSNTVEPQEEQQRSLFSACPPPKDGLHRPKSQSQRRRPEVADKHRARKPSDTTQSQCPRPQKRQRREFTSIAVMKPQDLEIGAPAVDEFENDGWTTTDSFSGGRVSQSDFRIDQIKTSRFTTSTEVTQYWTWKPNGIFEHQVLREFHPKVTWGCYQKPMDFHIKLADVLQVQHACQSRIVMIRFKASDRGHILANFKRERTQRRFLSFLRQKHVSLVRSTA